MFSFKVTHRSKNKNSLARTGIMKTSHGKMETPYLIPVATRAFIIGLSEKDIKKIKTRALLSNTYHLYLKPGDEIIKKQGGLHKLMNFKGVIFTDSGGFQAFSLGDAKSLGLSKLHTNTQLAKHRKKQNKDKSLVRITDSGVHFKSIYDNSNHFLDAKRSMEIQSNLGADAIMAFDECSSANKSLSYQKLALKRTNDWALLSLKYKDPKQALYGIIQGGKYKSLRQASAKFILSHPFEGIAVGGSFGDSYGDSKKAMSNVLDWISPTWKNDNRPRHMLGIGWIDDIFNLVDKGIDTFDCVHMTRIARHGNLFISPESGGEKMNKFRIKIKKSDFANSKDKIDKTCRCEFCKSYNRLKAHNLAKQDKFKFGRLATIHNITFMLNLMKQIRQSIKKDKFQQLKAKWLKE
jgi:queuine tRNA-ribosyltransferase/7-cyano-7-deazaguanine tRNA-ribosyltransferase